MINIILALTIFILISVLHELAHYFTCKYYGNYAKLKWVSSKEKHTIGFFGLLPGCIIEYKNIKQLFWITFNPMPIEFIGGMIIFLLLFPEALNKPLILFVIIIFSLIFVWSGSRSDIKDYKKIKKPLTLR